MAGTFVQQTGAFANSVTASTVVVPVTNLPTVGDTLIANVRFGGGFVASSVTDPRGNTWTIDKKSTATLDTCSVLSCKFTTPYQAGDSITFTGTGSSGNASVQIEEYSGLLTADQSAANNGTTGTSGSSGATGATTTNGQTIIAALTTGTAATSITAPASYTERPSGLATIRLDMADLTNQPSGSTPNPSWTWAPSGNFAIVTVTYIVAAAPAGGANQALMLMGVG